jgi:DNA-binding transcriptional regulator YiaG
MMHENCSGRVYTKTLSRYPVKSLGIDGVELFDAAEQVRCTKCGVLETTIPSLPELIAAAALARVGNSIKLNARDIRYLRRALGWQSKTLAKQLSVAPATVTHWERDDEPMNHNNEKLLRLFVIQHLADRAPAIDITEDQVLSMEISAIRRPNERVHLPFWRLVFKQDRKSKPVKAWDLKELEERRTGT